MVSQAPALDRAHSPGFGSRSAGASLADFKTRAALPSEHPLAGKASLTWKSLADQEVVILARREGTGSYDAIQAAFSEAGFVPRLIHSPSTIGTILQYVEAGDGIGIVPESATLETSGIRLIPLKPSHTIPQERTRRNNQNKSEEKLMVAGVKLCDDSEGSTKGTEFD